MQHRLDLLTAEKNSLQTQLNEIFTKPPKTTPTHPLIQQHPNIPTANTFSALKDQHTPQPDTNTDQTLAPPATKAHNTLQKHQNATTTNSSSTLEGQQHTPHHNITHPIPPTSPKPLASTYANKCKLGKKQTIQPPPKQNKTPKKSQPPPAQIIIFSNSMCKRIREDRFHWEKSTKVYAKGGATIAGIQKLVEDSNDKSPEFVILQAWTNTTARKSFEEAERMARCLIETTLTKFPHAKLILSGIFPRFWDDEANQVAKQLNESFKYNCKLSQRVKYVDHTKCALTEDGYLREDLYWDDVHLNNKGLSRMVINLRKSIDNWSKNSH